MPGRGSWEVRGPFCGSRSLARLEVPERKGRAMRGGPRFTKREGTREKPEQMPLAKRRPRPESQRGRFPPPALGARTTGVKLITFPLLVTPPPTVPSTGAQIKCQHSLSPWPFLRTLAQGNRISSRDAKGKGC